MNKFKIGEDVDYYEVGEELYYKGKYDDTYLMIEKSLKQLNNNSNDSLNYMGCCLIKLGEHYKAIEVFDKIILKAPDWERPVFNKGRAYLYLDAYEDALKCFEKAVAINPLNPDIYYYLGIYFEKVKNVDEALKCYKKSLAIDNQQPETHLNLGIIYCRMNEAKKALREFNKAILLDSEDVDAFFNKGLLMKMGGKLLKAIANFEAAYRLDPSDKEIINEIIEIYKELKNQEKMEYWRKKLS